jgi:Uma2 family endonuclease
VLAPDIAILRATTSISWAEVARESPWHAVEVLSYSERLSERLSEIALKAQQYRAAGVDEAWVVDHRTRRVQVWTAQGVTTFADT